MDKYKKIIASILCFFLLMTGIISKGQFNQIINHLQTNQVQTQNNVNENETVEQEANGQTISINDWYEQIPAYNGNPYVEVNHNVPFFSKKELKRTDAFENYSPLDELGRCGVAYANICEELMPDEDRGDISKIKPSGWKQNKIDNHFVWQRCHLIAFCLAGENDNPLNLVTGTGQFNVKGMLPFENTVREYIHDHPYDHVLYRVTPVFEKDELVCRGVLMEAASQSDHGYAVSYNVFVYNVSDSFRINYKTGKTYK